MTHWPWALGGVALASVAIAHWWLLHRMLAVSGRITTLVDRFRRPKIEEPKTEMTPEEIIAAVRAATLEAFGGDAMSEAPALDTEAKATLAALPPQPFSTHLVFFAALTLGGLVAAVVSGGVSVTTGLHGVGLAAAARALHVPASFILFVGGLCVGAGTRMAGGCTSGHGLCGLSRFQTGSLLATVAFFGAGILVSVALGALL